MKPLNIIVILSACLVLQGCILAGAAVGATGAMVGTGVKVVGAVGRAMVPGERKKDREAREFKAWQRAQKAKKR